MLCRIVLTLSLACATIAKSPQYQPLPPLKEQAEIQDGWRAERLATIPSLLEKYGFDAWIVSQKEYAEETVFWSLKPAKHMSARRRTTWIFFANSSECSSHKWIDMTPKLWSDLRDVLEKCDPKRIAIDAHHQIAFASGLHAGEALEMSHQLGPKWTTRMSTEPMVAVEYIATMPRSQLKWYHKLQETAWAMISEAFSERVVVPGTTTTEDVEWWLREKIQAMNYSTWFHPDVTVLRSSDDEIGPRPPHDTYIQYEDLLHVDFGVTALGLNTDTQHLAYVLPPNAHEQDIPKGLRDGLSKGNALQDIVRANMKVGRSGNENLESARKDMRKAGISGQIYSHPIGDWGHSAGPLMGMMDVQDGVPILGDLPLLKNMYYSVELYAEHFIPERNTTMNFFLEEDVYWNEETESWEWAYARQENFHLIRTTSSDDLESLLMVQT